MAKEFTIKKGHRLWLGNYPVTLMADTKVIFETVIDSPDVLAEVLASNPSMYAGHRDDLAHDEDGFENVQEARLDINKKPVLGMGGVPVYDIVAKPVKIHVTYGVNGERVEHKPGDKNLPDVKKQTAEQLKSVADADKKAALDAKKLEDDQLIGTPAETAALIKKAEQEKADAKGLADAKSRRDMEIANHNRPGGTSGPVV